ncbi:hypothetical protein ACLOAV_000329 [Pseudogymnoascus australis]
MSIKTQHYTRINWCSDWFYYEGLCHFLRLSSRPTGRSFFFNHVPAGRGFITTRDGKRCTAVPKTTESSSNTSIAEAKATQGSDDGNNNDNNKSDDNNDDNNDDNSDDVATQTVNPAANVVQDTSRAIQDAPASTTVDPPATTDPVVEAPSDTVIPPTTTPVTEIDPAAVASHFGATASTPIPTPTPIPAQTALPQALQPDPESATDLPIIVSDTKISNTTTSGVSTVPIPTTPPAAVSPESDIAFPADSVLPSSANNEQLIAVVPTVPTVPMDTPSPTDPSSAAESARLEGANQSGKVAVGHLVGGIVGGLSFIALVGCLWLYFMRRRRRDTLLTPSGCNLRKALQQPITRSITPPWGPPPSAPDGKRKPPRATTASLSRHTKASTTADPPSHFTRSRSASPSSRNPSQDLTQYLASKDQEMREAGAAAGLPPDHRRSISLPPPARSRENFGDGSLGIDFSDTGNPFSDPQTTIPATATRTLAPNPFADPFPGPLAVSHPQPSASGTYIADIRRSRGQSFSTPNAPSRHPSIRISRERSRDRDTMLSSGTTNTRRGKGRSDPFDLERPELLRGAGPGARGSVLSDVEELPSSAGSSLRGVEAGGGKVGGGGGGANVLGVGLNHESWTSRYSRGSSAGFSDWGDPGPDLGPRGGYGNGVMGVMGVGTAM